MNAFTIICAILLVYILIFLYKKYYTKANATMSGSMLYKDSRKDYINPDTISWNNDNKSFEYWSSDPNIQEWITTSPRLVFTKPINSNDQGFEWYFNSDGLFYVTYNSCFGLIHVSKDFGSNPKMTIISTQNRGYSGDYGLNFYSNNAGPHIFVKPVNNQSGVLMVFKLFDVYNGLKTVAS